MGKIAFFKKAAIWPLEFKVDPEGWLSNFRPEELDVAIALLDSFWYYAPEFTKKIVATGFHRLSAVVSHRTAAATERRTAWTEFRRRVIVTYPTDERPGATDSGRSYLRKARLVLGLDEAHYLDPQDALAARIADPDRPIVFLDDFAGSGSQFCHTWERVYNVHGTGASFKSAGGAGVIAYLPVLASHLALTRIGTCAPSVLLLPGHTLGEEYSALHRDSLLWPTKELQRKSEDILFQASDRAGIPLGDGSIPDDWCGFHGLGLAVAIDDTIPDACLTLLYWETNQWRPLFRRP